MAKAYVCDACGVTMTDPYEAKMREFYVGTDFDYFGAFHIIMDWKLYAGIYERLR